MEFLSENRQTVGKSKAHRAHDRNGKRAISRLMGLHFIATESEFSYLKTTRTNLQPHDKTLAFYSDKAGMFHWACEDVGRHLPM